MISQKEFKQRRKRLMRQLKRRSVAVLASAPVSIRNNDAEYPYRQASDFFYLTGFNEPEAVAVLIPGRPEGELVLFCREYDENKAIWTGRHAGLEGALAQYGVDEAYGINRFEELLPELLEGMEHVYYPVGTDLDLDDHIMSAIGTLRRKARAGARPPSHFIDLNGPLHDLRLYKSTAELDVMRKAGQISGQAHRRAMQACRPGMFEYQIEAEILHEFTGTACVPRLTPASSPAARMPVCCITPRIARN
jgi:Xaa-Pro aminopeptidase